MAVSIEEVVKAQKAAKIASETEARAVSVKYDKTTDRIVVELRSGIGMHIPRSILQGLSEGNPEDLDAVEILGGGQSVYWPTLDAGFTIPGLASQIFGTRKWMASLGGSARSQVKTLAARKNGARGGRPKRLSQNRIKTE